MSTVFISGRGCDMVSDFVPSSVYMTVDPLTKHFVYAFVIEVHCTCRAVFALIYDHTWGYISLRWCRVQHDTFCAGRYVFHAHEILKDSACVPPQEVLNFLASRA